MQVINTSLVISAIGNENFTKSLSPVCKESYINIMKSTVWRMKNGIT